LILEAKLRQSLVTTRSLGSRGLRVAAFETSDGAPTFWSRWCRQGFVCATDGSAEAYLRCLEQVLDRTDARVLISSSDANVELICRHREQLEKRVCIALAGEPALKIALNKERTLEVARQLGLHVPQAVTVKGVSEVKAALDEIGLPAVVKPVQSWVWNEQAGVGLKGKLVTTPTEARRIVEELTSPGVVVLFQQFLSGRREAVSFLYAHGQIYARFAQWAKRMAPPLGGTSVLRQSIAIPPDIGVQAERLVREIELEGYSEVEFRRDSAGKPYLMEINPRLSASVELAVRAGVDFPYLLYQWAIGDRIDTVKDYRAGFWMRYLRGDLAATIGTVLQRGRPGVTPPALAILDFCTSFFVPMRYDYLDWKDLLPAWAAAVDFVRYLSHLVGRQLAKEEDLVNVSYDCAKTTKVCPASGTTNGKQIKKRITCLPTAHKGGREFRPYY
jgi:predicted ATP-grasp superfamily ATP-dependent carboligase